METINMMELNPLLFNIAIATQCLMFFVFVALGYKWWTGKIGFFTMFGIVFGIGVVMTLVLIVVAIANNLPLSEVFKVLVWFNPRR